jgi:hypothetical protein
MINNFDFKNPLFLSLITFVIITIFQIYKNYYKNNKDIDDYSKSSILKLIKAPIIAAIITWLVANFLLESIDNKVETVIEPNSIYLEPELQINMRPSLNSTTLQNIYLDPPDF